MKRQRGPINFDRRNFMKMAAGTGISCTFAGLFPGAPKNYVVAAEMNPAKMAGGVKLLQSACPYCGVGCGTLIKVQDGKVVGVTAIDVAVPQLLEWRGDAAGGVVALLTGVRAGRGNRVRAEVGRSGLADRKERDRHYCYDEY